MIKTLIIFYTLLGMSTMYATADHHNNPLYCDRWNTELAYTETAKPFIAVPVEWYLDGAYQCYDDIIVTFEDGTKLHAQSLDAGPFGKNCVLTDNGCVRILVDIPEYWWTQKGISARASVLNISQLNRALPQDVKVGYLRK